MNISYNWLKEYVDFVLSVDLTNTAIHDQFLSIKEAINNDSGKTSSKKLIGFITSVLCLLLIVVLVFFYFFNMD